MELWKRGLSPARWGRAAWCSHTWRRWRTTRRGAVGNGIVEEGIVSCTLGTSGVVFAHMEKVAYDPAGRGGQWNCGRGDCLLHAGDERRGVRTHGEGGVRPGGARWAMELWKRGLSPARWGRAAWCSHTWRRWRTTRRGAVGNGIVEEGIVSCTLGTSGVVFAHMEKVAYDPAGRGGQWNCGRGDCLLHAGDERRGVRTHGEGGVRPGGARWAMELWKRGLSPARWGRAAWCSHTW